MGEQLNRSGDGAGHLRPLFIGLLKDVPAPQRFSGWRKRGIERRKRPGSGGLLWKGIQEYKGENLAVRLGRVGLGRKLPREQHYLEHRPGNLAQCADTFVYQRCEDCGAFHLVGAGWRCGDRMCAVCAHHRARRMAREHAPSILDAALGRRLLFLTVTLKNVERLTPDVYRGLKANFKRLRRHVSFKHILGGLLAIETTRNHKEGTWHPHIHAILVAEKYVDQEQLQQEWKELTGDSYIVKVKKADAGSVRELLKYPTKLANLRTPAEVLEFAVETWGVRMLQGWGCLFGVRELPDEGGEIEEGDLEPFVCVGCGSSKFQLESLPWDQDPTGPIFEAAPLSISRGP
ncbi:MAG: protein rep [Candidatus Methylomirabilales bacterium]